MIKPIQKYEKYILVGDMQRIGLSKFFVRLEHEHFNPRTELNDVFEIKMLKWPEDFGLIWYVLEIPATFKEIALKLLDECGLRAADGVPNLLGGETIQVFPISGDNVFTIEYVKDNPAYKADYVTLQKMKEDENKQVQEILSQEREELLNELSLNHSPEEVRMIVAEEERRAELQLKQIKEKLK